MSHAKVFMQKRMCYHK